MPNPFELPQEEDQAQAQDNPFTIPAPPPIQATNTEADLLQEQSERRIVEESTEIATQPRPDGTAEREWSRANVEFEDMPTPRTYPEAIGIASKKFGTDYRPNPQVMDEIDRMSSRMAWLHMARTGMIDDNGPVAGVDNALVQRLQGAYLHNLSVLYADITPEEQLRTTQRAVERMGSVLLSNAQSRLQRAEQNVAIIGGQRFDNRQNIEAAQQDFAMARELISRAGEPKVQAWFLGTATRAVDQLARTSLKDTLEADENEILSGILQHAFKAPQVADWPQESHGSGPLATRFDGLLKRNITLQEGGKARALATQRAMEKAFRGSLIEERLDMFNIAPELAEVMDPTNMLVHTHPRLVGEMANVLAINAGRRFVAQNAGGPLPVATFNEKVEEWVQENGAAIVDDLISAGTPPLLELRAQLDNTVRSGADELKNQIDAGLGLAGRYMMTYSDEAGDAIGVANKVYEGMIESAAQPAELIAASTSMVLGFIAGDATENMGEAIDVGEQDAELAIPQSALTEHQNRWLGDMRQLTKQVTDGDRIRLGLSKEASERIFNSGGNPLRQGAIAFADEIAALSVDRYATLGFHPSVIREAFREIRNGEFSDRLDRSILSGVTEERWQEYVDTVRRLRQENGGGVKGLAATWKETLGLAFMQLGRDVRGTAHFLMGEPDDLAVLVGGGLGGGYIGNQLLRGVKSQTLTRMARMQTATRANIALQRLLRESPDAADQVRRVTTLMQAKSAKRVAAEGPGAGLGQRHAALEAATDAMEYAADVRRLTLEATPDLSDMSLMRWHDGQLKKSAKTAAEITRHLDPRQLSEVLDDLQLDGITRNWIQNGSVFSTLRQSAALRLGWGAGNKRVPFVSGVGRNLFESIENDPTIDLTDLPISPEAVTSQNLGFLGRMFPERRRQLAVAKYQQDALRWMSRYQQDTIARRSIGAENRANLEQFTLFARTVEANRLRRLAPMRSVARETGDAARSEALEGLRASSLQRVSRARAIRQELIDSGTPLDRTRLRGSPFFDDYTPEQMLQFIGVRHGKDRVYQTLRREFESEDSFWARVSDMGRRFDFDDEVAEASADSMRRQIIAEFFEQPGLDDTIRVDLMDGHITPGRLRRNIRERKALGRAFLADELDELAGRLDNDADRAFLGELMDEYDEEFQKLTAGETSDLLEGRFTTRKNLASEWEEVRRRSSTERSNRFRVVQGISGAAEWGLQAEIIGRIGDGRSRTAVADARAYGLQQRLMTRAYTKKLDNLQRQFTRLSENDRALFNAVAAVARDQGITGPLNALRKRKAFRDYFNDIAPETDDAAVQHLWDNVENFRKSFLKDGADVGLIDKAQFDKWIGPYAPRLFSSTQLPKIYGTDGVDLSLKASPIRGASLGELQAQRHLTKVKAQIYPKGGRPITQLFDTVGEAEDWIANNYGIRGAKEFGEEFGGEAGNTAQGSQFAILRPLGKEAQELGADFIQPGAGMFIQMRNLVEDMTQIRYFNAFDRKGISFDADEFRAFANANPREARKYKQMPDSNRLGALSGKWVHRGVVRQMDNYSEVRSIMGAVQDAVEAEAVIAAGGVTGLIDNAPGILTNLNAFQKAGIAAMFIARNPATMVGNFLSDALFFTRMAAGSEINLTGRGWALGKEAFDTVRGVRSGKLSLDDLPEDMRRGIELGVVDESIFEDAGLQSTRRQLDIEATYGQKKSPGDVFLAPFQDANLRKAMEREAEVDALLKRGDLSPRKEVRLLREKFALQKQTESGLGIMSKALARAGNIADALVGRWKGRTGDIETFSMNFYGDLGNTNRLRAYLWNVREKGMEPEAAAKQVNRYMQTYGQIGTTAVGRQVKRFGKSTLGSPVISFPFELARISLNVARHNPAALMAIMGSGVARNMMAIAASGMDPYEGMEFLVNQPGGVLNLMGNQFIPLPNQQALVVSNPALNIYGQVFNGQGTVNGLAEAWEDAGDQTFLSQVMRTGTTLSTNFMFTAPLLNTGMATWAKRDSISGDVNRDGYRLLGDNLRRFMSPMIHPLTPRWGTFSEKLQRTRDAFPHAYSGREHSLFNRVFELGGIKIRGDASAFLDALPASLGDPAKDAALRGTKALAWLSLFEDVPDARVFANNEGLGIKDYFAMVVASSAYLDPQNGHDMAGANEQALKDLRRGIRMRDSEDPAERARGDETIAQAEQDILRLRTTRQSAAKAGLGFEVGRRGTEREVRNIVDRMVRLGEGYDEALESFSVLRRTGIVARMATTRGVPEEMMDNLFRQYMLTRSGGLRGPAGAEELEQARNLVDTTLRLRADLSETNTDRLERMRVALEVWGIAAEVREEFENATIEKYQRANAILKEARQ